MRSGNDAARGHRRQDGQARAATARSVGERPAARPPASASCGSINQARAVAGADRAEVPPPGGPARSRCRRRARRSPSPAASSAMWVGVRGNPGLLAAHRPQEPRASRAKTIELPDGVQNIAVGGGAVWVIARRREHRHAPGHRERHAAPDLRRREAVRRSPTARGAVWVTNNGDDTVTRIDSGSLNTRIIPVGRGPKGVAVGAGAVWVANSIALHGHAHRPRDQPARRRRRSRSREPLRRRHATATTCGSRAPATARSSG